MRTFDTAPHYGAGLSERRLGAALRERPRDEYVLSTKVGRLLVPGERSDAEGFGREPRLARVRDYSRDGVRRSLEDSLERLGLDRVDVALVHDAEDHLEEAIAEAFPRRRTARAGRRARDRRRHELVGPMLRFVREADVDCILCAGRYTLLDRSARRAAAALRRARHRVLAGGVFNSGMLAGGTTYDYRPAPPELLDRRDGSRRCCDRYDVPLATAALAFPLRHPAVTSVVVGARSPEEIAASVARVERPVPEALWDALR